jgi:hypothetical protein
VAYQSSSHDRAIDGLEKKWDADRMNGKTKITVSILKVQTKLIQPDRLNLFKSKTFKTTPLHFVVIHSVLGEQWWFRNNSPSGCAKIDKCTLADFLRPTYILLVSFRLL